MPSNTVSRKTPLWREAINFILLPAITFLLLITWTLGQIGSQERITEINQKAVITRRTLLKHEETKTQEDNEDPRIAYKPEIIA